jgi:hypothetical protein
MLSKKPSKFQLGRSTFNCTGEYIVANGDFEYARSTVKTGCMTCFATNGLEQLFRNVYSTGLVPFLLIGRKISSASALMAQLPDEPLRNDGS